MVFSEGKGTLEPCPSLFRAFGTSCSPHPRCRETSHRAEGLSWYLEQSRGKLQAAALLHKPPQSSPLQEALMAALLLPLSPEHSALGQFLVMRQPWVPAASIPRRTSLPVPLTVLGQSTPAWISTTGGLQPKLWARNPGPTTSLSLGYSMASWAMAVPHYLTCRAHQLQAGKQRERERVEGV